MCKVSGRSDSFEITVNVSFQSWRREPRGRANNKYVKNGSLILKETLHCARLLHDLVLCPMGLMVDDDEAPYMGPNP
jgi:hypothetical protein